MSEKKLRILLIMEQCNPDWSSVPLVAYNFFKELSEMAEVTLCTHGRNRDNLEKVRNAHQTIVYFPESTFSRNYYRFISPLMHIKGPIWPLVHTLSYPIYSEFNQAVYKQFREPVSNGVFDIVHAMTPIIPRYPYKIIDACQKTPFILGPVNGGIPFPKGFSKIAVKEWAFLNILRRFCEWIPGYKKTYQNAHKVLVGSSYTGQFLKSTLKLREDQVVLFPENGVQKAFFAPDFKINESFPIKLLFVGRLVPYKGADLLIQAIAKLEPETLSKVELLIVGDGEEKKRLMDLAKDKGISNQVEFKGWIEPSLITKVYKEANIFCFPSVREFGGAVILEAMAAGLPSIIVDYGGIGEYTTEETSIKIVPKSSEYIIEQLTASIKSLVQDSHLRARMSLAAIKQAHLYEWSFKIRKLLEIYKQSL